ncbi:TonB-dependent receptor [Pedobacter suwonensis]|uniref:TonB-dependent receptor n=1 Tax=Pedobacter suwonensis TaxID=332999 RepID=UPI00119EFD05|nr:TonB-dependent receptor [Pedobacter suwonensis]
MYKKFTELLFRRNSYVYSNYLLKMKLTFVFLIVMFLQVRAEIFAQKININADKANLKEVIAQIRKQTDYDFLYNNADVKTAKPISLKASNMDLIAVLEQCFKDQPVRYTIKNKTVLISRRPLPLTNPVNEQKKQRVTGSVTDAADGGPIVGASVLLDGTKTGATTDVNGNFSLDVPGNNAVLVISFIGYETKKINYNGQATMNVRLKKADTKLQDIVVVGYGTRTKGAVTGAISTVKSEVFENRALNNSLDALQGTIPGFTITKGSGQPGAGEYGFNVRGSSSINGNSPLVLVDGVPTSFGTFNTLNPADIAEVTVLKDASAAIYGARAGDGVIIVTTKKGRSGPPEVSYSATFGLKEPSYLRKMQNTLEFAEFMDEGLRNVGIAGFPQSVFDKIRANAPMEAVGWNYNITNYPGFFGYTDWNKEIYKSAIQQLHNISISGGGENNNYLFSAGYNKDEGIVRYGINNSQRYNLRLNYDFRLTPKLNLETRTSYTNLGNTNPTNLGNALTNVTRQFPYQPVFNPFGQFYGYQGYENPAQSLSEAGISMDNTSNFATNFKADYSVIPGLKLTAQAALRLNYNNNNYTLPTFTRYNYTGGIQDIRQTPNSAQYSNSRSINELYQLYADYNTQFGESHKINITAGTSIEKTKNDGQNTWGYNFVSNDIFTLNLADRTNVAFANFGGFLNRQSLGSYFGRVSYSFKDKLILDVTARADGSSKFAEDKRWSAVFPSAALAYNLSEERFIKSIKAINQLKLRASWGKMGNQEIGALGLYDYIPLVTRVIPPGEPGVYPIGSPNAGLPGVRSNPASADRTWETIENRNIGVDVAMLNSRLSFSFDYFNKINNDMLVAIAVPATFGGSAPSSNQGKLKTKGFDAVVTWKDNVGAFRYSVSVQLSDAQNKLLELKNSDNPQVGLNQYRQGYAMNSYFGYVFDGIIQNQAQLDNYKKLQEIPARIGIGDAMFKDLDGDGVLTPFGDKSKGLAGDMQYLGDLTPRYTFSSNINLGWKQFDLQIFVQGVGKRNVQYGGNIATPNTFFWPSLAYYNGRTWSPNRPEAQYPRFIPGNVGFDDLRSNNYRSSTLVTQNVAYLRFKVITVGYNLPENIAKAVKLKSARLFLSGTDLFTISKGTLGGNFDPEDAFRNEGTYPFSKIYSIGLNVKF